MNSVPLGVGAKAYAKAAWRHLKRLTFAGALGGAALVGPGNALAGDVFTGQFGTGGTWNLYEAIDVSVSFKEALAIAASRPDPTGGGAVGHLVTLSSLEENNFVHSSAGGGDRWIGLTDRAGAAPDALEGNFTWVTGEPVVFTNWNTGEPNNAGVGEDAVHLDSVGKWNDNASGFNADDPIVDFGSTAEGYTAFGYVIEWSKNLATQPTGFPTTLPDPALKRLFPSPLARMPGPNGTANGLGVQEVRFLTGSGNTRNAIAQILSGEGQIFTGEVPLLDLHDPDQPGADGAVIGPRSAFISDNVAINDTDIQSVIKGTITVPQGQGGEYTFNVRSDDGFALRILSQANGGQLTQHRFTASNTGLLDEDGTLAFMQGTGDSNTRGVVNLPPGTYDVEFVSWQGGGGAYWEVSTAKGNFVADGTGIPRWNVLGDPVSKPSNGPFPQVARLTAPATVQNFGFQTNLAGVISTYRSNPPITAQGTADDVILMGENGVGPQPGTTIDPSFRHVFPNGGGDNFSTAVTGSFQVLDTDGAAGETLTFGLFADDNAALHIVGQNFTGVGGDVNAVLTTPAGESDTWLVADYRTGNTNAYGLISLQEGTYNFEAFQIEEGGGAALQVFVAPGDRLAEQFAGGAFLPLSIDTLAPTSLPANPALVLTNGPGTGPVIGAGDFDGNGVVDGADFLEWQRGQSPNPLSAGDLATWKANFGSGGVSAVPEPAALGMLLTAAIAVASYGRRRNMPC